VWDGDFYIGNHDADALLQQPRKGAQDETKELKMLNIGRWPKIGVSALLVSIALAGCAVGPTSVPGAVTEQRIEAARTPADHEALAADFAQDAAGARAKAAEHRRMAASYRNYQPGRGGGNMQAHCNALVRNYEAIAAEFDGMAAAHRQMAVQAKP
jgi:hypothetical protein